MTKAFLIGAAAAALLAVPASAQPQRPAAPALDRAPIEARIAEHFQRVDANRDGFVTREEAEGARDAMRAQRQERRGERRAALFARLDADRNGVISREEFERPQARAEGERGERGERRAERGERRGQRFAHRRGGRMGGGFGGEAFARLDSNGDGRVSLAEATAGRLQRFDRVDSNRDGRIDREEAQAARAERGERTRQAR
jgi:Ca2+-binding EF-hand superfamily protein